MNTVKVALLEIKKLPRHFSKDNFWHRESSRILNKILRAHARKCLNSRILIRGLSLEIIKCKLSKILSYCRLQR